MPNNVGSIPLTKAYLGKSLEKYSSELNKKTPLDILGIHVLFQSYLQKYHRSSGHFKKYC